jgi:phosphate transport system permease protein
MSEPAPGARERGSAPGPLRRHPRLSDEAVRARLGRRYRRERRLRFYCVSAVVLALSFLALLFVEIVRQGWSGFLQTAVRLEVAFDPAVIDPQGSRDPALLAGADYAELWREPLRQRFPVSGREERRELSGLVAEAATYQLRDMVMAAPELIGQTRFVWLPAASGVDLAFKGKVPRSVEQGGRLTARQAAWMGDLERAGDLRRRLNRLFFTSGDSRDPVQAGLLAAVIGSFYAVLVTVAIAFPLAVATAIYLEEFAPKNNRWIDLIEVNVNNLAAVPSIVFGLLGLAVFLGVFGLPRSSPLVGGLILSLMTLPVIIIAARVAIQSVPPSIRQAAYAVGATPLQVIQHHVLPMAMPGILTGTIIGIARAVGETAPLLMIGMVAFIVDIPKSPLDPATALPVQIFLWADSPERGFVEKTSAAIIVLLAFLITMNSFAVLLRRRWQQRF